jgi:hypothetical protein
MIASMRSRRVIVATSRSLVIIMLLLAACAHSRTDGKQNHAISSAVSDASFEGEIVTAVVERLEAKAHEDVLEDGSVLTSDVVALAVISPEPLHSLLFAHMHGHPRIGGRPMLLGDRVQFVLPHNWKNRDLSLEELDRLAFAP